jgi:uncharacterized protein (TIGR02246 family)
MNRNVQGLYRTLLDGWNDHDGDAMASCFDEDGEMIGFDGSQVHGRSDIAAEMNRIFADHETATFVAKIRGVQGLAPDVALLRAVAGMVPPGGSDILPERNTHHTVVARRRNARWLIKLFQNTPARFDGRPELVEQMTAELRMELETSLEARMPGHGSDVHG